MCTDIERQSVERHKAMADLPHMKRFKNNMKRRRIKQILEEVPGQCNLYWPLLLVTQKYLAIITFNFHWYILYSDNEMADRSKNKKKRRRVNEVIRVG